MNWYKENAHSCFIKGCLDNCALVPSALAHILYPLCCLDEVFVSWRSRGLSLTLVGHYLIVQVRLF